MVSINEASENLTFRIFVTFGSYMFKKIDNVLYAALDNLKYWVCTVLR